MVYLQAEADAPFHGTYTAYLCTVMAPYGVDGKQYVHISDSTDDIDLPSAFRLAGSRILLGVLLSGPADTASLLLAVNGVAAALFDDAVGC